MAEIVIPYDATFHTSGIPANGEALHAIQESLSPWQVYALRRAGRETDLLHDFKTALELPSVGRIEMQGKRVGAADLLADCFITAKKLNGTYEGFAQDDNSQSVWLITVTNAKGESPVYYVGLLAMQDTGELTMSGYPAELTQRPMHGSGTASGESVKYTYSPYAQGKPVHIPLATITSAQFYVNR
jgi:hypothetical protein